MESIISALIGAGVAIITCLINNATQQLKAQHQIDLQIQEIKASNDQNAAVISERIATLSEHVKEHNNLVNRMYNVEALTVRLQDMVNDLKDDAK